MTVNVRPGTVAGMQLINIDNGGTFTDICVVDGDRISYTKTITTPFDLSQCLFDGLTKAAKLGNGRSGVAALLQETEYIRYSTTQGTNALVQRRGPRLGLLVADETLPGRLATGTEQEELFAALVGDRWTAVDVGANDDALSAELVTRVNELSAKGASRLVVSVGGAAGPETERRLKALLLRLYPRQLLGAVPLLFTWELAADRDDVRRTWSSLLNAFLHPAMERFLFNAELRLRDFRTRRPLLIFRNDGGSSRVAKSSAIKTYSSGPRGGLEGTRALARSYGFEHVLMVDVGGTSTDVGVVDGGAVRVERRGKVEGVATAFELAAITSHGVGGSSVIRVDRGTIRVGPASVGAAPGPACFGLGGTEATITDVYLLTGLLDPLTYLDGSLKLEPEHSRAAIEANVARPLGVSLDEALARMEEAYLARVAETLRAEHPGADTVAAAFGGAGPMTICGAARLAGVRRALIPRTAAVFSAFGIGYSDISQHYEFPLTSTDERTVGEVVAQLRRRAERDLFAEGVEPGDCTWSYRLVLAGEDAGTVVELDEPLDLGAFATASDVASLELHVVAPLPHVNAGGNGSVAAATPAVVSGTRAVRGRDGRSADVPVFRVTDQTHGAWAGGPAVIEGPFFTMGVPSGWRFEVTSSGDLLCTDERSTA